MRKCQTGSHGAIRFADPLADVLDDARCGVEGAVSDEQQHQMVQQTEGAAPAIALQAVTKKKFKS